MCARDWSGHGVDEHDEEHRVAPAHDVAGGAAHVVAGGGGHGGTHGGMGDSAVHHDAEWNFVVGGN